MRPGLVSGKKLKMSKEGYSSLASSLFWKQFPTLGTWQHGGSKHFAFLLYKVLQNCSMALLNEERDLLGRRGNKGGLFLGCPLGRWERTSEPQAFLNAS